MQAKDLAAKLAKYTKTDSEDEDGNEMKRWYWPLVKCVTVRVPDYKFQHVTLIDLPGNGDTNKSRDRIWKAVLNLTLTSVYDVYSCYV